MCSPARRKPPECHHARRGYSLVELLMVVAIVAIVAAIAMPKYANAVAHYRADAAASRLAADLRLAQQLARATSKTQTVSLNASAGTYQIAGLTSLDRTSSTYGVSLAGAPYFAQVTAASFTVASPLTFDRYGTPSAAASVTLRSGTVTRTVTVDATTAAITIQ